MAGPTQTVEAGVENARKTTAWRDFPPSFPSALQPSVGRWMVGGGEGKSPSLVNFRLKFLPFPGDREEEEEEEREGGERGERGEEATPNKNKRAFPPLHPKLDFNFRDIINFSRPLSSQPRSRPRVSSPPEKKRKRKGRTRYYLEIRGSVTPVVGG